MNPSRRPSVRGWYGVRLTWRLRRRGFYSEQFLYCSEWRAVGRRVPFLCSPVVGILKMGGGGDCRRHIINRKMSVSPYFP